MRNITILLLLFVAFSAKAQKTVYGIVRDADTGKVLPFATITSNGQKLLSDADGNFSTSSQNFSISYRGYKSQNISAGNKFVTVRLKKFFRAGNPPDSGVEVATKMLELRDKNHPFKKFRSFKFSSHNKLLVTANPDSIAGQIDTIRQNLIFGKRIKIDSTQYKIKNLAQRQHFFASEKTSQFEFDGENLKETITGTRMSGFKEPLYEILGLNFQSFSIYDDTFELFETSYRSPLSSNALRYYRFSLLDTLTIDNRAVYGLYFKHHKKTKGTLEGVLYIDAETYAVAKYSIRARGILKITAKQEYSYFPDGSWFPKSRSFRIDKGNSDDDIRILGETIKFDGNSKTKNREKQASDFTYLISRTDYSDFVFNVPVSISHSAVSIEVRKDAINRDNVYWAKFTSQDRRERNTYIANDSIVAKEKIERKLRFGRKIINGYIPFGPVDLDLRQLLSYNNYEGFRLGIGGVTNDRFSEIYKMDAYSAYGTKDGKFKYHLGNAIRVGQFSNSWIGASYTDDVREIASTTFATDKRTFKIYDPRPINVSTFYTYQTFRAYIETRIIPKTESIWQATRSFIQPEFNYIFLKDGRPYSEFHLTIASASLQWNPYSDFMQTPAGRFETEKRFPKFSFQFTKAFDELANGDFDFLKIDLRGEYEQKFLDGQKSSALVQAGFAYGDVPLTHLYSTSPNNLNRDAILQRITLAGKNSFETMYFNEFFSSHFISLQLKHQFRKVILAKKIKPSPVIVTRMVWGTMEKPEQHLGIDYKTLDDGFFESGFELNQIFSGFGISSFYRYGPYQLPRFEDNLSIKISFILNIGI